MKRINLSCVYVPLKIYDLTILRPFHRDTLNLSVDSDCKAMMLDFKSRDICKYFCREIYYILFLKSIFVKCY